MNANLLKAKMTEKQQTQEMLAEEVGISTNTLNRKLKGRSEFTLSEVIKIIQVLDIGDSAKVHEIFLS